MFQREYEIEKKECYDIIKQYNRNYIFVAIYLLGRKGQSYEIVLQSRAKTQEHLLFQSSDILRNSELPLPKTNYQTTTILANDDRIHANKSGLTFIMNRSWK